MKVIINLSETVLDTLEVLAKADNRSRKNYMEATLSNHAEFENMKATKTKKAIKEYYDRAVANSKTKPSVS